METFKGSNLQILRKYVVPQMLGLVCNSIYFIVDGIFIGNRLGAGALAAAGIAVPVVEFMIAFSMFWAAGAGIYIATALGRGEKQKARGAFNHTVRLALVVSVVIMLLGVWQAQPLAKALGATPTVLAAAGEYLFWFLLFSPFLLFSFVLSTFARNDGHPTLAMVALMAGSGMNVLLDYVFMYPLGMGIKGAALATGLGPVFSVLILLPVFIHRKGTLYFEKRAPKDAALLPAIAKGGLPALIAEFSIGLVTLLYNRAIVRAGLGDAGLAAYLVIGYAALISLTAFLGAAEGIQPVVSYLHGAGEAARVRSLKRTVLVFISGVAAALYLCIAFGGNLFFGLFIRDDAALLAFTGGAAKLYFVCLVPAALNILLVSFYQCTGRSVPALLVSLARSVGFTALFLALLPGIWPQSGLWIAVTLAEVCTLLLAVLLAFAPAQRPKIKTTVPKHG